MSSSAPTSPSAQQQNAATVNPLTAIANENATDDDVVEADDHDGDSGIGSKYNSDSTSIASSMYAGYVENGRRYQTKREGEYWGPSDEKQWESMHAAHILCTVLDAHQPNPLFRAPVTNPHNILDVGTGGGVWALEVADKYPSALVQGVDLYPPPETWVAPNCKFEVDDVLKPWTYKESFDLIHMRLLLGSFTDNQWKGVYKQAYENLAPGGWIEQLEGSLRVQCDDETLDPNSAFAQWDNVVGKAFASSGKPADTIDHMRARIEAAGFINMQEKTYKVPIGYWAKNPLLKEAGRFNKMQFAAGMEGFALFALTKYGQPEPWSVEEVQAYLEKVREDVDDPKVHAYGLWRRVWGQKPMDA